MRILLFGATGQVGRSVLDLAQNFGVEIVPADRVVFDLSKPSTLTGAMSDLSIDGVINAAAYTAVDKAEDDEELARAVNSLAPMELAKACSAKNIPLVHYSTDYVFAGTEARARVETDPTKPLGVYGSTKLEGERLVAETCSKYAILRLAWVFSPHGSNFVKTMLRLAEQHSSVRVVADQIGTPTPASAAANAGLITVCALKESSHLSGVYHFAGDHAVSWAEFAEAIFAAAKKPTSVEHITTAEFPTRAKRPKFSVLSSDKFKTSFGLPPADWRDALSATVKQIDAN